MIDPIREFVFSNFPTVFISVGILSAFVIAFALGLIGPNRNKDDE